MKIGDGAAGEPRRPEQVEQHRAAEALMRRAGFFGTILILNTVCGVLAAAPHKVLFMPSRYRTDGRSGRRSVCNVPAIETR